MPAFIDPHEDYGRRCACTSPRPITRNTSTIYLDALAPGLPARRQARGQLIPSNVYYEVTAEKPLWAARHRIPALLDDRSQFRLELDEQWPGGAQIAPFSRGKAFSGLLRIFEEGGFAHPHQDTLQRDAPWEPVATELTEQFAMNIYLQTSTVGGELELWNMRPSIDEYTAMRNASSHGIERDKLPPSAALIKPQDGDLILFRSTNLHAVHRVEGNAVSRGRLFSAFVVQTSRYFFGANLVFA